MGTKYSTNRQLDCSVPQGSLAGPNLYLAYASTLQEIVPEEMCLNGFADDHSLKRSFKADDRECRTYHHFHLTKLSQGCYALDGQNRLHMNEGKTEFIMFGAKK